MVKLIVNNFFKNIQNYRDYRYWPIVVRIPLNALLKSGVTLAVRIDFENCWRAVNRYTNVHLPPLLRFIPQFAQICVIFARSKFEANPFFRPVNIEVREGATILAAIFNNILGIILRPVAFFTSIFDKFLKTTSTLGICRENEWSVCSK